MVTGQPQARVGGFEGVGLTAGGFEAQVHAGVCAEIGKAHQSPNETIRAKHILRLMATLLPCRGERSVQAGKCLGNGGEKDFTSSQRVNVKL